MTSKIIIVDDHKLFNDGLKKILDPHFEIVAQIYDGKDVMHAIQRFNPDLVILDINLPNKKGLEIGIEIKQSFRQVKVAFLSMYDEAGFVQSAKKMGADGYILKDSESEILILGLKKILNGEVFFDKNLDSDSHNLHHDDYFAKTYALSKREIEVIGLAKGGLSAEDIAQRLCVSFETVRSHRKNIYFKLGINKVSELTAFAIKYKL